MRFLTLVLLLVFIPGVYGAGLLAQSPGDNATIESGIDAFTFSVEQDYRTSIIASCSLLTDGTEYKNLAINDKLEGQTRQLHQDLPVGTYTWMITCESTDGLLSSEPRTVHVIEPVASDVEVYSSGVTRGSLVHEFTMENDADQTPINVPEVAPGDYLLVNLELPPSIFAREFYVKSRLIDNGQNYVRVTSEQETFYLYEGENTTLPVGSTSIIVFFESMTGSKSNFVVYPLATPKEEEPPEEEPPEVEEPPEEPEPEEEEPVVETPPPVEPNDEPPQKRQGFFSWVLSLLTSLFGA